MVTISGSVGKGGRNLPQDIKLVQDLLNKWRAKAVPRPPPIATDGQCGKITVAAIEDFQKRAVRMPVPDGRVDPNGRTWQTLLSSSRHLQTSQLSGATWWHANQSKYANSTQVSDLSPGFRPKVEKFLAAMRNAKINIAISTTRRSKGRAYLMHYSWMISKGSIAADKVPPMPGVDIEWDHGDLAASRRGASEMVALFKIAYKPSLNSRHIEGNAIDMTLTWHGKITIADHAGRQTEIGTPGNGDDNLALHKVGAGYGVIKNEDDPPHWSTDGH